MLVGTFNLKDIRSFHPCMERIIRELWTKQKENEDLNTLQINDREHGLVTVLQLGCGNRYEVTSTKFDLTFKDLC